jgi:hypothetical protein
MAIPGKLLTTAMAVMPHRDVERALALALSLDVPFWPQLPHVSYYEDMYVQAAEHFPGILLDMEKRTLRFSMEKFLSEFEETLARLDDPGYLDISPAYSVVYPRFLELDLAARAAIRGQLEGPISFGLNVLDTDNRPIIFNDSVRPFMLEFMARRVNVQLKRLQERNANAFMFVDEPGLQFVFSAMAGYGDRAARADLETFFAFIDRPRGVHLCGNPDWDFLLGLDLDVLSFDAHSNGEVFVSYAHSVSRFLDRGGVLIWGIVPTNIAPYEKETLTSLASLLQGHLDTLAARGVDRELLLARSMISPATCCLVNPDGERTVERAFHTTQAISIQLRERLGLTA